MFDNIIMMNGQGGFTGHGDMATRFLAANGDMGEFRPFIGKDGRAYKTRIVGYNHMGQPIKKNFPTNAATLRKDEWIELDRKIITAARERLRAWSDLRNANTYTIANGMGTTVLESERVSDGGSVRKSMDGRAKSDGDRPQYDIIGLPLPMTHGEFDFGVRQVMASKGRGQGVDYTQAENTARRMAESLEDMTIGNDDPFTYAGYTSYGMRTFPSAQTFVLTAPTAVGWTPDVLQNELLAIRQQLINAKMYGPYKIYNAPAWDAYLDRDYSAAKGDNTLRDRLLKNRGIGSIDTLDRLGTDNFRIIVCQMTSDVARAVVGMEMTPVQWLSPDGMSFHWKIMCIMVAQYRTDQAGNCGLLIAAPAG